VLSTVCGYLQSRQISFAFRDSNHNLSAFTLSLVSTPPQLIRLLPVPAAVVSQVPGKLLCRSAARSCFAAETSESYTTQFLLKANRRVMRQDGTYDGSVTSWKLRQLPLHPIPPPPTKFLVTIRSVDPL
jgi:hypothetical protein